MRVRLDLFFFYFFGTTVITTIVKAAGLAAGVRGFALAPYQNGAIALSVFLFLSGLMMARSLDRRKPPTLVERSDVFTISYLAMITAVSLVDGLAARNSLSYIVSSSVYGVNMVMFAILFPRMTIRVAAFEKALRITAIVVAALLLIGFGGSQQSSLFLLAGFSAMVFGRHSRKLLIIVAIPILMQLLSQNRATLLAFGAMLFLAALIYRRSLSVLILIALAFGLVGFLLVADMKIFFEPGTQIYRRLLELQELMRGTTNIEDIVALQQRLYEIHIVNKMMSDASALVLFLGNGFGVTLDMSSSGDASVTGSAMLGADAVHNIHSLYHAIYLRYGGLGLTGMGLLILAMFRNVIWGMRLRRLSLVTVFAILYPIGRIVTALPAGNFFFTDFATVAIVLYASNHLRRDLREAARNGTLRRRRGAQAAPMQTGPARSFDGAGPEAG